MDAITLFRQAAQALQKEECYKALEIARRQNDEDEDLQEMIGNFNLARIKLNDEMNELQRNEENIDALNDTVNELYNSIMQSASMQEYNRAKSAMNPIIEHINAIVAAAVDGQDPMQTSPPEACAGGCGGCSGCGSLI